MSEKKYNNIPIAENILFSEDVHGIIKDNQEIQLSHKRFEFLRYLVAAEGRPVSNEILLVQVWEGALECEGENSLIIDTVKFLRKILDDKDKSIICNRKGVGYYLGKYRAINNSEYENTSFPIIMTYGSVMHTTSESIVYRENDIHIIYDSLFGQNKKALLMTGFGGVGKTSIARLFYSKVKDKYDSTGWAEYHIDIKHTICESFDAQTLGAIKANVFDSLDDKWLYISNAIKNSNKRKLIIIDNVDFDYTINQNPTNDYYLQEISGWTNTDVILTSRLPSLAGYYAIPIDNLGDEEDDSNCINLFYHYRKSLIRSDENISSIRELVRLAGYNTMLIELFAKSSFYEESISSFNDKLKSVGFSYPEMPVATLHEKESDTVQSQLSRLFALRRRSEVEKQIVICFRLLPEGEMISKTEFESWLGYSVKDVDQLVREGWIRFEGGFFSVHPLIRQSVQFDDSTLLSFRENMQLNSTSGHGNIYSLLNGRILFNQEDSIELSLRKLKCADCLFQPSGTSPIETLLYLGDYSRKLGIRDLALKYYKFSHEAVDKNHVSDLYLKWKATYYYGYLLSYTKNGMLEAEKLMNSSLEISLKLANEADTDKAQMIKATSYDHLAYVLFNKEATSITEFVSAEQNLNQAIKAREILCKTNPNNKRYLHDLSWSQDNIGCLLTKLYRLAESDEQFRAQCEKINIYTAIQKAEDNLLLALATRRMFVLENKNKNSLSEVAWTLSNLAVCYACQGKMDANAKFEEAIEKYKEIDVLMPGYESSSLAKTFLEYGRFIYKYSGNIDRCIRMLNRALVIYKSLETKSPGIYEKEIDTISKELQIVSEQQKRC